MSNTTPNVATLVWTECKACGLEFGYLRHTGRGRPRLYCSAHNNGYRPITTPPRPPRSPREDVWLGLTCTRCGVEFMSKSPEAKRCMDCRKGKGEQVAAYLEKHYPCGEVPFGVLTELAKKFGITRERIRQIRNKLGYQYMKKDPDTGRKRCEECNERTRSSSRWCPEHRVITLPCAACGKPVAMQRSHFLNTRKHDIYSGRVFCDRVCSGRYAGKSYGWANPTHPKHAIRQSYERVCVVCGLVEQVPSTERFLRTCREHRGSIPISQFRRGGRYHKAGAGE